MRGQSVATRGTIRAVLNPFDFLPGRYRFTVGLLPPGRRDTVYDVHLLLYLICVVGDETDVGSEAAFQQHSRFHVAKP